MVWFFIIVMLMTGVAVALVMPSLFRSHRATDSDRKQQNIAIAREHLRQLEIRQDAGQVTDIEAEQERSEIELALLNDVNSEDSEAVKTGHRGRWASVFVAAVVPFVAGILYLLLGQPSALVPGLAADREAQVTHGDEDLATLVQRLETDLEASPDNVEGWFMLGNSYMHLKQYVKAAAVFQRLRGLVGDDPDVLVRQADALAMQNNGILAGKPEELVRMALQKQPNHRIALWLAGMAAQRRGDLATALDHWRLAEPLFDDSPQSQMELRNLIAQAEKDLPGGTASAATANERPDRNAVKVLVSLHDSMAARVNGSDTVFILARAVQGPPMPVAVVRRLARELPLTVTLDDTMAMVDGMNLSSFEQVDIIARVSRSGEALAQSGDLIGQVSRVTPGPDASVEVVISEQVQ